MYSYSIRERQRNSTHPGSKEGSHQDRYSIACNCPLFSLRLPRIPSNLLPRATRISGNPVPGSLTVWSYSKTSVKPSNFTLRTNTSLLLSHPQQVINSKTHVSDSQSPYRPDSLFSPILGDQKSTPPKGPMHEGSLLTPAIHNAVNEAVASCESTTQGLSEASPCLSPDISPLLKMEYIQILPNPVLLYSPQALAYQYAMIVDARNALILRQSAIVADIGLYLESLIPKIQSLCHRQCPPGQRSRGAGSHLSGM